MNLEDLLILAVLAAVIAAGIRSGAKHFRGEGGCCGGGSVSFKKRRKKLKHAAVRKKAAIEGMTCQNCARRVENSINAIDGAAAKVYLRRKEAVVSMEKEVSDDEIKAAVERAGYKVVRIS